MKVLSIVNQRNKKSRKLIPKDVSRLQNFPKNFKIPVSDTQAYKKFGNSVPVNVIKEVAIDMINSIN